MVHSRRSFLRTLPVLAPLLACLGTTTAPDLDLGLGAGKRLLFIGNSLTYANDLPAALSAIAALAGDTLIVRSVAFANYALEDHWNEGTAIRALRSTTWDVVLLQQGPSSLPDNQLFLRTWTERFAPLIRAAGATPALYMVWPSESRPGDWPGVKAAYRNAAAAVDGMFVPAGEAWRVALTSHPTLGLYGPDGFHPSATGTLLAALVIYERVSGRDVSKLNFQPGTAGLSAATWRVLQDVAHATVLAER